MFQRIWAIGDIHGSHVPIEKFWERNKNTINYAWKILSFWAPIGILNSIHNNLTYYFYIIAIYPLIL